MSASSTTVPAGAIVTDTFTITNPDAVVGDSGVIFTDAIPSGVSFGSGTTSTGVSVTLTNGVATANLGTITPGQSVTVTIALQTSKASIPSFVNTGQITASMPMGTVTASVTTTVVQGTDLVAAVLIPPTTTTGQITFLASVYNLGPIPAQAVSLADTFTPPAGAKIVSESVQQGTVHLSGNVVTATIGTLPVGSSAFLTVVITTTSAGAYTQSIVASSSTPDPTTSNNTATLTSTILGQDAISVTPSANFVAPSKPLTLEAQVSVLTGFRAATLSVTFLDGSTPIGTAMLDASGHASLVISNLAKGPHSISVSYAGDPNYPAVTTSTTSVRVGKLVAGDFDGDGKADLEIYDQTASAFIVLESGGGSIIRGFGNSKDVNFPVSGDFDGDGKSDVGIYDRTASTFIVLESGGGSIVQHLGNAADADIPLAVDLDDDGKADLVVYDSALAEFFADESGGGMLALPLAPRDTPTGPFETNPAANNRTILADFLASPLHSLRPRWAASPDAVLVVRSAQPDGCPSTNGGLSRGSEW